MTRNRQSAIRCVILGIACAALLLPAGCSRPANKPPVTPGDPTGLAAFPGAEGFGAAATGGRGGRVLAVTTLAADPRGEISGSLQWALNQTGPRTIVFRVSGLIDGWVEVSSGDFTLAGQTSPGGVTVRGLYVQGDVVDEQEGGPLPAVAPRNFIIRHLRMRPGNSDADDGLRLHRARLGIVDHCSFGNATDEAVQISLSADITIQYCHLAETLGSHVEFGGMLINYSDPTRGYPLTRLSIHHNVWNRIMGRMPEISRENFPSCAGTTMDLELTNNVAWDGRRPMYLANTHEVGAPADGAPIHYNLNLVGNLFCQSPGNDYGLITFEGPPLASTSTRIYMAANRLRHAPEASGFQLIYCCNDFSAALASGGLPYGPAGAAPFAQAQRHAFPALTVDPADDTLLDRLAAIAGAFPRDAMDSRLLGQVRQRQFDPAPLDTNPASDTTTFTWQTAPAPPADTDGDGMPDAWEAAQGLNPGDPADGAKPAASGFTNLELYLHQRHLEVLGQ